MAGERLEVFATGDDPELRARIRAGAPEVEPVMKRDRRVVRVLDEEKGVLGMRGDDLSGRHLRNIETEEETRHQHDSRREPRRKIGVFGC